MIAIVEKMNGNEHVMAVDTEEGLVIFLNSYGIAPWYDWYIDDHIGEEDEEEANEHFYRLNQAAKEVEDLEDIKLLLKDMKYALVDYKAYDLDKIGEYTEMEIETLVEAVDLLDNWDFVNNEVYNYIFEKLGVEYRLEQVPEEYASEAGLEFEEAWEQAVKVVN